MSRPSYFLHYQNTTPEPDRKIPYKNWSLRRKYAIVAVLCLASFSGAVAPLSAQLNLGQQSTLYHKTVLEESYAVGSVCPVPCSQSLLCGARARPTDGEWRILRRSPALPPDRSSLRLLHMC